MFSQYGVVLGQEYWEAAKATLPIIQKLLFGYLPIPVIWKKNYWGTARDALNRLFLISAEKIHFHMSQIDYRFFISQLVIYHSIFFLKVHLLP